MRKWKISKRTGIGGRWLGVALLAGLLLCGLAGTASAGDGILEINQSCVAVGCFAGDAPGWPVTLDGGGSYRLTSDLDIYEPGNAIEILADGTTLDLAGFGIRFCTDTAPGFACLYLGSGDGISGAGALDVTVRNGVVQGFLGWGVYLGARARVEGLVVRANGDGGIRVGTNSLVEANRIGFNQGPGALLSLGTGWGRNVLVSNSPDFSGAPVEITPNVCGNETCIWQGPRRYYMTSNSVPEDDVETACVAGFRPAYPAELHDPSSLHYDAALGRSAGSALQDVDGWVRGLCSRAHWDTRFFAATGEPEENGWKVLHSVACNVSSPVWCIEE